MAEITAGAGDDAAEVTVSADTSQFDEALNQAAESVRSWTTSVSDSLGRAKESIDLSTGNIANTLSEKLGSRLEARLGSVGRMIGGNLGREIGLWLGKTLGGDEINDALKGTVDVASESWDSFAFTVEQRFGEVAAIIRGLDVDKLLDADFTDLTARLTEIGDRVELFFGQMLDRTVGGISRGFEKIQEPLAQAVQFIQNLLQRIGLIEQGTDSWGDALRDVKDVGEKVFTAIARAVGFVWDALKKIGGAVGKFVVVPFIDALKAILTAIHQAAEKINDLDPTGMAGKVMKFAGDTGEFLDKQKEAIGKGAQGLLDEQFGKSAEEFEKIAKRVRERGREQNITDDTNRLAGRGVGGGAEAIVPGFDFDTVGDAIASGVANAVGKADPTKLTSASLAGTREAANLIARASLQSNTPQMRATKAAEDNVQATNAVKEEVKNLVRAVEQLAENLTVEVF